MRAGEQYMCTCVRACVPDEPEVVYTVKATRNLPNVRLADNDENSKLNVLCRKNFKVDGRGRNCSFLLDKLSEFSSVCM